MKQRGRKTAGALMAVAPIERIRRLPVPQSISNEAREIWAATVAAMPADWFTAQHIPVLESYCRHIAFGRRIAGCLDRIDLDTLTDLPTLEYANRMFGMHARETKSLAMLATRMRLTHSSVIMDSTAGARITQQASKAVTRPWEEDDAG